MDKPVIVGQKPTPPAADKQKDEQRETMLALGRELTKVIEEFFKDKPADMMLIYGGIDYVIRLQKERRNAIATDFLKMKKAVEALELKVHEPFANDGVDQAPDYFAEKE